MATRYFNWKLATVLMVGIAILIVAACALHRWQRTVRAVQALPEGKKAYAAQDWDAAADRLGSYLIVNRDDVDVLVIYADAQLKRRPRTPNNVEQAIAAYRDILRLDSRHREATKRLIEVYLWPSWNAPGEAKLIAENYLKTREDVEIRRMLADALRQQRMFKEAADELNKILKDHPEDVLAYERMGILAEQNPDVVGKPAAAWYDDAVAANPQAALAYLARAGFYLRQKDRSEAAANPEPARQNRARALADLAQAEKYDLSDKETRLRLVSGFKSANMLDKAREQLQTLQAKDPTEVSVWLHWADLAVRTKSTEEMYTVAETALKALAAQPWDFLPVATELLIRSGHVAEANECIARLRKKDVDPPATAYLEGLLADKQGRLRDAVADWRTAITLGYRPALVRLQLAYTLTRLGDTQSAIGQLRMLVADAPGNVEGRMALARLLAQTGNWPEVQEQALQVQQLSPGYPDAILLELQARAQVASSNATPAGEREKAWQEIDTRLAELDKRSAGDPAVKLLQTRVAMMRGRFPEAAALLKDLEAKSPADVRVALFWAELYALQGRKEQAQERFQDAVAKFPQASEPVRGLAGFFHQQNQRQECETVLREGIARLKEPSLRRELSLVLADFYNQWKEEDKLTKWLSDMAVAFPGDIQPKRLLLTRNEIVKDGRKAQAIVDEIHALEGEDGYQWRYEQARLWARGREEEFKTRYPQIVKLLQENLQTNAKDHPSRLLLAETYERANEVPLAVSTYREAHNLLPDNLAVLVRTATILTRVREYDEARRLLDEADQRNLHDPALERLRLLDDVRIGKLERAGDGLEKMIQEDPNETSFRLGLAVIRIREKKFDEAQKILDDLKAKTPDSLPVTGAQVGLYVEQGRAAEAIQLCDQTVEKLHNAAAYNLRARTYIALKQNDKALEDFGRVIALDPQQAQSWAARAEFCRMIGRIPDGMADVKRALALAPDNSAIQRLAATLFIASGDMLLVGDAEALIDKALAAYDKVPVANTGDPKAAEYLHLRLLQAQALMLKGTGPGIESARRILREVTGSELKLAEAWELMGRLELSQEEPAKALDAALRGLAHSEGNRSLLLLKARAEKARSPAMAAQTLKGLLDQNPRDVEVLIELADAYARSGRTQQAVDLLRQKLPEFEGRDRRRCELAYAEAVYADGQREEAKSLFDKLMQADPNDPIPTMTLAQQLRRERRWTEMNQLVHRWLTTHPRDAEVATIISRVLAATGDKQALQVGEDILRMTLQTNPQSLPALMLLGMMMQNEGRNEESIRLNRQILQIDPNNVIAMNNLAWMLCERENQPPELYKEALALTEKGLKIVPDYMDLLDTRGYAFYRLDDFEKARSDFDRCIKLYPPNSPSAATPRFHLALTYAAVKRKAEALEQLRIALDANGASFRLAKEQADNGRPTHAIKVLRDALQLQTQMEPLKAVLGLPGQANGPSPQEMTEATSLLDQLQKGTY